MNLLYQELKFYSKEQVEHAIATLPDDLPDLAGYDPVKPSPKPTHVNGSKMTATEVARMNKVLSAQILLLGNTRKA